MKVIIGIVVLLTVFIIIGALIRKKIYREVDRLSLWKIEILNRPISDEISKVKSLHMIGETEKRFEHWRSEWERIIAIELPDIEETLIDAEEASDKYRFRKAKQTLSAIENELHKIEEKIEVILKEVNEWVRSEEDSKIQIVTLQAEYNETKQFLLSHYPSFGKAAAIIEEQFQKVDESLAQYEDANADGNYPKAEEILVSTQKMIDEIKVKLEKIPEFRIQLTSELPKKIAQLERDIDEMERKDFILERRSFQKELDVIRDILQAELKKVEADDLSTTGEKVNECNERVEALYDLLAKEVEAKQAVIEKQTKLTQDLEVLQTNISELKNEVQTILERYRIDDKDLKSQVNLEKRVEQLVARFETVEESLEQKEQSYTTVQHMLEEIDEKLKELQTLSEDYAEMLANLRKDEIEAKETIELLMKQLFNAQRLIERYNLPGVPDTYFVSVEEAEEKVTEVEAKLKESPLDIPAINYALKQALKVVELCLKDTEDMIETSLLSEKLIQYGNRYKSSDPSIAKALQEAEEAFRNYLYADALEIAARAIEPIDPDALKKINVELEEIELSILVKS
ncbi:septation ring formation regulator EzrA [Pueribacillus sp. YX66]|uniref:septation ring formation regulator EzrA n=1 Tax=Pueribacillus sp. YX66 TaxID=3229242 RepID=UPI00358D6E4F